MNVQGILDKYKRLDDTATDYWNALCALRGENNPNLYDVKRDERPSVKAMLALYEHSFEERKNFLLTEVTLHEPKPTPKG